MGILDEKLEGLEIKFGEHEIDLNMEEKERFIEVDSIDAAV